MRSFCSSLLVVRALGAGLTGCEGKRDGLNGNVVFTLWCSHSRSLLSLLNTAGWPEGVGRLHLLGQPCLRDLVCYFLHCNMLGESTCTFQAVTAALLHALAPWHCLALLARLLPCDLQAPGAEKRSPRSMHWHGGTRDLPSITCPLCSTAGLHLVWAWVFFLWIHLDLRLHL